ncbi:hypothetical protein CC80DRAFT_509707 [Byssothecium circinans]|uniref:Uncharacterized protein n=1 Tax=Byssothecium circinans TaxID=147558 RepID=A0A6A5TF28_9PLEO|nr:hypothetical protein CC80DRAFT_509707 [Byssothecium circinans]
MRFYLTILTSALLGAAIAAPAPNPTFADCAKGRKNCEAMVQMLEDTSFNGKFMYWGDQNDMKPKEQAQCLNHLNAWGMSSVKFQPHKSGKRWGCRLYRHFNCEGEYKWYRSSLRLFNNVNDRVNSMLCFFSDVQDPIEKLMGD